VGLTRDIDVLAADLKRTERRWLRRSEDRLNFEGLTVLDDATARNARLAYRMLLRET
jgi:hypothetical protein